MTRLVSGSSVLAAAPGRLAWLFVLAALLGLGALAPAGAATRLFTPLYSFPAAGSYAHGAQPIAGLTQGRDGSFYGTTEMGGAYQEGTVFKVSPSGALTTLYSFSATTSTPPYGTNSDGAYPNAPLLQGSDGNFYGATFFGGPNDTGTIFKITPAGALTTLSGITGFNGSLIEDNQGNFYGAGGRGGNGNGVIFKLTPQRALSTLYSFTGGNDGGTPNGIIVGSDGSFYGTTQQGGNNSAGTVFKLADITTFPTIFTLYTFNEVQRSFYPYNNAGGGDPYAGLVQGGDGNFYGTATYGGADGTGTVFKITPSGTYTVLHDFSLLSNGRTGTNGDGAYPQATLLRARDGNFYGTTQQGGTGGTGTVFEITPSGTLTTLYSFSATDGNGVNMDGAEPVSSLVQGSDGNLYGTTQLGGQGGTGAIFKISIGGVAQPTVALTLGTVTANSAAVSAVVTSGDGTPLTYAWSVSPAASATFTGATTGTVTSGATLSNTIKVTKTGNYIITITVTDAYEQTASASTPAPGAQIEPVSTSVTISPSSASIQTGASQTFTANVLDQFGNVEIDPSVMWSILAGDGAINGAYADPVTFTAPNTAQLVTLQVVSGSVSATVGIHVYVVPTITGFTPASGPAGTVVTITGTHLTGTTVVGFTGKHATSFTVNSDTQITATVPAGAQTGLIAVLSSGVTAKSTASFTVTGTSGPPTITGISPASGPVGTTVTITGTNLTGTTVVGFQGKHAASFTVNGAGTQITTTVPAGAQTGPIAVLTNGIEAKSSASFTVTP